MAKRTNSIQKLVIFLSLAVFVTANVGMAVYTHTCSISGTEKSLFLSYEDPCSDEHPVKKKSCCSEDTQKEEHFEKSCCSTDTEYVALDIDTRTDQTTIKLVLSVDLIDNNYLQALYSSPEIVEPNQRRLTYSNLPPPKYQGRDLQSIHQVYLI